MVTKSMEEYKLCNLLELKPDILRERNNNSFCKRCIGIGASRSICSPPSYKKKTRYDSILEKNKHKKMIIIGTGALVQSFKNFYDKDSCCEVKNMFDEASLDMLKRDSNVFYILANREWWKMRIDLEQHGLQEDIDFMVYNTYYR